MEEKEEVGGRQHNVILDDVTWDAVRVAARMERRSGSGLMRLAILDYLVRHYAKVLEKVKEASE